MTPPNAPTESVWDYPRPPRLEATSSHIRIVHCGVVIAETTSALRVLETFHPPVYYIPPSGLRMQYIRPSRSRGSFCEFKGTATYWNLVVRLGLLESVKFSEDDLWRSDAAWSYAHPTPAYAALRDHLAFYASRVDECWVDNERVTAQPGDFYGGWITSRITGPFKGPPGTLGW